MPRKGAAGALAFEPRTRALMRVGRELRLENLLKGPDGRPLPGPPPLGPDGRSLVGCRTVGWLSVGESPLPLEAYVPNGADLTV